MDGGLASLGPSGTLVGSPAPRTEIQMGDSMQSADSGIAHGGSPGPDNIAVMSRRVNLAKLRERFPGAHIIDVTSRGAEPWVRFSPFFPHGGIPVPFSPGHYAQSVEGIWQGLKVFDGEGIDPSRFEIVTMRGLKRTVRAHGRVLGHQQGLGGGGPLLDIVTARRDIYLPSYGFVLEHRLRAEVDHLRGLAVSNLVVLLDFETNCDVANTRRPLSHAGLIAKRVRAV